MCMCARVFNIHEVLYHLVYLVRVKLDLGVVIYDLLFNTERVNGNATFRYIEGEGFQKLQKLALRNIRTATQNVSGTYYH